MEDQLGQKTPAASFQKSPSPGSKSKAHLNEHGFWINGFSEGLKSAQVHSQLVIVDFGARWCPSCVRLETEIFSSPQFQHVARNFVKVKLDSDILENSVLQEKYHVEGIPTVVITNSAGEEILRFVDYQPMDRVLSLLKEAKEVPLTLQALKARAEKTQSAQDWSLLWNRYFATENYAEALALGAHFSNVNRPSLWADAEVQFSLQKLKANKISINEAQAKILEVIENERSSTRSMRWRQELVEALSSETSAKPTETSPISKTRREDLAQENLQLALILIKNPEALKQALKNDLPGEYVGFEKFYVAFMAAETMEAADLLPETRAAAAWSYAYDVARDSHLPPRSKGIHLRWLTSAILSHQYDEALKIVNDLLKVFPKDGDLERRKLAVLVELHRFDEAIKVGELALANSYGMNQMKVIEPLAKAYIGSHRKDLAQALVQKYIQYPELQTAKLQELGKKLAALIQ